MRAAELRIGNYLTYGSMVSEVIEVWTSGWIIKTESEEHQGGGNPIPLTEEWLVRLGFEQYWEDDWDAPYYIHSNGWNIHIHGKTMQPYDFGFEFLKYKMEFVHQLQNLHFALTGEVLIHKI